jgi:membrane associated rhomboid family serine protease
MDWSLVLASQGIEHVIEQREDAGWTLTVSTRDYENALANIHQYRIENLHWRWRRQFLQPGLFFDWSSTAWVFLIVVFYWWSGTRMDLRSLGIMDGTAVEHGEWWRLFTATWLHADAGHLALNAVFGLLLLGLAMGRYGPGTGLLAAYLAGVGGNVAAWLIGGESHRALGASGVVMGALGLVTVQPVVFRNHRNPYALRLFTGGILGGVLLFAFLGLGPETDVVAHLGGFIAGMMWGLLLALAPPLTQRPWINLVAGVAFTALVIFPWLSALAN